MVLALSHLPQLSCSGGQQPCVCSAHCARCSLCVRWALRRFWELASMCSLNKIKVVHHARLSDHSCSHSSSSTSHTIAHMPVPPLPCVTTSAWAKTDQQGPGCVTFIIGMKHCFLVFFAVSEWRHGKHCFLVYFCCFRVAPGVAATVQHGRARAQLQHAAGSLCCPAWAHSDAGPHI